MINDFMAQFLSATLEKEGCRLSPIEIELLYLFNKEKSLTAKQIIKANENLNIKHVYELLNGMNRKNLIKKGSPYKLEEKGKEIVERCICIQTKIEPIIRGNTYYNRLYQVSSTSIKS